MVHAVVMVGIGEENMVDESNFTDEDRFHVDTASHGLGSLDEQLSAIASVKCILLVRNWEEHPLLNGLRTLQRELRSAEAQGLC